MRSHCVTQVKRDQKPRPSVSVNFRAPYTWQEEAILGICDITQTSLFLTVSVTQHCLLWADTNLETIGSPLKGAGLQECPEAIRRWLVPFLVWTHRPSLHVAKHACSLCWHSGLRICILIRLYLALTCTCSSFFKIHKHNPPAELCHRLSPHMASHMLHLNFSRGGGVLYGLKIQKYLLLSWVRLLPCLSKRKRLCSSSGCSEWPFPSAPQQQSSTVTIKEWRKSILLAAPACIQMPQSNLQADNPIV